MTDQRLHERALCKIAYQSFQTKSTTMKEEKKEAKRENVLCTAAAARRDMFFVSKSYNNTTKALFRSIWGSSPPACTIRTCPESWVGHRPPCRVV